MSHPLTLLRVEARAFSPQLAQIGASPGGRASIVSAMPRPTLLVAEPEPHEALSVRKLVLESAKFNVLTAHSTREALDLTQMFPNISAAVLVADGVVNCDEVAGYIKKTGIKAPVIFLSPRIGGMCRDADHNLETGRPEELLDTIRNLLGDPRLIDSAAPATPAGS